MFSVLFPLEHILSVCCVIWLHFIVRKNVRIVFATILLLCTMSEQFIVSILYRFFCVCLVLCMHFYGMWCSFNSHSPISFSGYIKFIDPSRTLLSHVCPFINELHRSWIFILIKWTSHFSTEKPETSIKYANRIQNRQTCFDRFQLNVESVFKRFNHTQGAWVDILNIKTVSKWKFIFLYREIKSDLVCKQISVQIHYSRILSIASHTNRRVKTSCTHIFDWYVIFIAGNCRLLFRFCGRNALKNVHLLFVLCELCLANCLSLLS